MLPFTDSWKMNSLIFHFLYFFQRKRTIIYLPTLLCSFDSSVDGRNYHHPHSVYKPLKFPMWLEKVFGLLFHLLLSSEFSSLPKCGSNTDSSTVACGVTHYVHSQSWCFAKNEACFLSRDFQCMDPLFNDLIPTELREYDVSSAEEKALFLHFSEVRAKKCR